MPDHEDPQSLALQLPVEFGLGLRCKTGVSFIVPVTVRARNITEVTLKAAVAGNSIIPLSETLSLSLEPGNEKIVVEVEFLPVKASVKGEWVSIEVSGGRSYQAAGFMTEVSESLV